MEKDYWVRMFVRQNIVLLTSDKGTVDAVKQKKKDFINQHNLKSDSIFENRQIAIDALHYLIETSRVTNADELENVALSSPFLTKFIHKVNLEEAQLRFESAKSRILKPEDLGRLSQEEFIASKTEEFTKIAKGKAEQEMIVERERLHALMIQLDERMKLADKIKSELDSLPEASEPEKYIAERCLKDVPDLDSHNLLWWECLGLSGDPFPTKLGLNRIPQEKYEEIVVKTAVFNNYEMILTRRPSDLFGKTILIIGQFGSGKTTFLQYLSHKAAKIGIFPLFVTLEPMEDPDQIRESLYSHVLDIAGEALKKRGELDPRSEETRLDISSIASCLKHLANISGVKGFLLSIDGLHLAEKNLDSSLEFVKLLQNFQESIDLNGVNISILIAGSPYWMRILKQNSSFGGSYHHIDEVPYLSPEGAFKLIQNRLKAFQSDADIPVFIDKTGVDFAFRQVAEANANAVTFRAFIDYILPRLEKGEYSAAGITVAIDREAFEKIHSRLKQSIIAKSYELFRRYSKGKPRVRESCQRALEKLYRSASIDERDEFFQENKGGFWVLSKCSLIQKVRPQGERFGWGMSKDLLTVLENLNELGIPPEIVFRCFGIDPERLPDLEAGKVDPTLDVAQDFIARWGSEWPELVPLIEEFIAHHKDIPRSFEGSSETLHESCQASLKALISGFQFVLKTQIDPKEWTENTWVDLSTPETIISILTSSAPSKEEAYDFLMRYYQSARVLIDVLSDLLKVERVIDLVNSSLSSEDLRGIFKAAVSYDTGDLDRSIDEINTRLEKKIRSTFHLAFSLHFGRDYSTRIRIPGRGQQVIEHPNGRGAVELRRRLDSNLFYHFSRGEYAQMINENEYWEKIWKAIFSGKTKEEVVGAIYKSFTLDTRRAHRDKPEYFREVREEVRKSLIAAKWILESLDSIFALALNPKGFVCLVRDDAIQIQTSFIDDASASSSTPWIILKLNAKEIHSRIQHHKSEIDVTMDSAIVASFGHPLPEVCLVVATLIRKDLLKIEFVDGKSRVLFLPITNSQLTEEIQSKT